MTDITCRLTAKNRDQLRNPTLCNRVWATFTYFSRRVCRTCSYTPAYFDELGRCRSTWGDAGRLAAVGARLAFVVARADPARSAPGLLRRVAAERRRRGDVVQAAFVDDYVNLTAKTAAALRWAVRACPRVGQSVLLALVEHCFL